MRCNNKYTYCSSKPSASTSTLLAYVAVEEGTKTISLKFALTGRTTSDALVTPEWKIKIRQLECPKITTFLDKFKNYQAAKDFSLLGTHVFVSIDMTCYPKIKSSILLAPHYAVQYFTERTGYIKTFGFDDSADDNKFTVGQKYAIAFKRSSGICGVKYIQY